MMIKKSKRKALENKGWKFGTTSDFLGLSPDEIAYIELKLALGESLKSARKRRELSQGDLAALIKSSQSRIAKMEAGDPSVSIDLLVRSLLALGVNKKELARAISSPRHSKAA